MKTQVVYMRMMPKHVAILRQLARKMSYENNADVSFAQLVNEAIENYWMPKIQNEKGAGYAA